MMEVAEKPKFDERIQTVRNSVEQRLDAAADWVVFYREVLGVGGLLDELFGTDQERLRFEQTEDYARIQQAVAKLREKSKQAKDLGEEATRVITVRLPKSLHEALRNEAHQHKTSMNQLCISKLLQVINGELVPSDLERRATERNARTRTTQRTIVDSMPQVKEVEIEPEIESEPQPELPTHPLAVGGIPMSNPYTDSMTGGRPF